MAQQVADRRDIDFVLYEQLDMETITSTPVFSGMNRKMFDLIIGEARKIALKELLPTNAEGDQIGVRFKDGRVTVPECFHQPFERLLEGEWMSMTESPELGGQGLPNMINIAALEYIWGANYCLANYGYMGHGTGKMIELFGTEAAKRQFVQKLYTGEWGGTMLLTEPSAGSDVGALTTSARRNPDGTYSLTGSKIFITNGEHDLTENIIHPVLARIEGAPEGTRGISIFIVPKIWVQEDGSLGPSNGIVCTGVEEKLGIHASATCSMALGEKEVCRGILLGEENQGMQIMFHMMNEARFNVGFQAFTYASSAYLYAANYAKQRIQGKDLALSKEKSDGAGVPIIRHPDVRRMLLWSKAHVDGMRSFLYYVSSLFDRMKVDPANETREKIQGLIDFFIPLVKAYCSQRSFKVCVQAMQVYGGYGYIKEYPIEQLMRDCKITSIYEGTDGIQAMDLLGRKLAGIGGKRFSWFLEEVRHTLNQAGDYPELSPLAEPLVQTLEKLQTAADRLRQQITDGGTVKTAFAFAFPFLEVTGDAIMAWMLLWRSTAAVRRLKSDLPKKEEAYYQGILKTTEFFLFNVLPTTQGKIQTILNGNSSALDIPETCFGG